MTLLAPTPIAALAPTPRRGLNWGLLAGLSATVAFWAACAAAIAHIL